MAALRTLEDELDALYEAAAPLRRELRDLLERIARTYARALSRVRR